MTSVLLVEDEDSILHAYRKVLRQDHYTLHEATTAATAVELMQRERPDVVVLDVHLPDATGLETFDRLHEINARTPIILVTGHGTTDLAIEAIKRGAYEYLLKPLDLATLRAMIQEAAQNSRRMHVAAALPDDAQVEEEADRLIGRCGAMQSIYKQIGRVAAQNVTVLITGESGTGKELVARAIYQHSDRSTRPFLAINCASIPESLLESELFGHERGAFTGADRKRIGKFEQCHGGTIFLDEVGEMPLLIQAKILRLIQEQAFERVGGSETIRTDVRIIAATNADLTKLVAQGKFRSDLNYRFRVYTIELPPLRERGDDVVLLFEHFLRQSGRQLSRSLSGSSERYFSVLRSYDWPGNVRELQNVVKQLLLEGKLPSFLGDGSNETSSELDTDVVKPHVALSSTNGDPISNEQMSLVWSDFVERLLATGSESIYEEAVSRMEREIIPHVLRFTRGNQLQAARLLGMSRNSLRSRIRALKIQIGRTVEIDIEESIGEA